MEEEADTVEDRQRQIAEVIAQLGSEAVGDKDAVDRLYAMPEEPALKQNEGYSQAVFDELNIPRKSSADEYAAGGLAGESMVGTFESKERLNTLGKVADLKLDAAYQKKSEVAEQSQQVEQSQGRRTPPRPRQNKTERTDLSAGIRTRRDDDICAARGQQSGRTHGPSY